jgi:hypothetical protein
VAHATLDLPASVVTTPPLSVTKRIRLFPESVTTSWRPPGSSAMPSQLRNCASLPAPSAYPAVRNPQSVVTTNPPFGPSCGAIDARGGRAPTERDRPATSATAPPPPFATAAAAPSRACSPGFIAQIALASAGLASIATGIFGRGEMIRIPPPFLSNSVSATLPSNRATICIGSSNVALAPFPSATPRASLRPALGPATAWSCGVVCGVWCMVRCAV